MKETIEKLIRKLKFLFTIKPEDTVEQIEHEIRSEVIFRGVNLWVLHFAIIIACIGLNINSKSAIIGSMIISPLMGPVYGIGYGLMRGFDDIVKISIKNFVMIIILSVITSTLYFSITPLNVRTSEIESFSQTTIFDILIAYIGGMAAFLAFTRFEGNRYFVGISVATSCIPPLCAAGYGLSHLDFAIFLGGIYLFLINGIFILIGTITMAKILNIKSGEQTYKITKYQYVVAILLVTIPSLWLSFKSIRKQVKEYNCQEFWQELEEQQPIIVLKEDYDHEKSSYEVFYSGKFDTTALSTSQLQKYDIEDIQMHIHKVSE